MAGPCGPAGDGPVVDESRGGPRPVARPDASAGREFPRICRRLAGGRRRGPGGPHRDLLDRRAGRRPPARGRRAPDRSALPPAREPGATRPEAEARGRPGRDRDPAGRRGRHPPRGRPRDDHARGVLRRPLRCVLRARGSGARPDRCRRGAGLVRVVRRDGPPGSCDGGPGRDRRLVQHLRRQRGLRARPRPLLRARLRRLVLRPIPLQPVRVPLLPRPVLPAGLDPRGQRLLLHRPCAAAHHDAVPMGSRLGHADPRPGRVLLGPPEGRPRQGPPGLPGRGSSGTSTVGARGRPSRGKGPSGRAGSRSSARRA